MAYEDFKDLNRRTFADKMLCDITFNIAKAPKYDGYQRGLALMVDTIFDKKRLVVILKTKIFLIKNQRNNYTNQLLETLIKGKHIHLLLTIFGVQISQICN